MCTFENIMIRFIFMLKSTVQVNALRHKPDAPPRQPSESAFTTVEVSISPLPRLKKEKVLCKYCCKSTVTNK